MSDLVGNPKYWFSRDEAHVIIIIMIIIIIIIIIIISIFKEDNVFSMIASIPYGLTVNTDIDYYRPFFGLSFL